MQLPSHSLENTVWKSTVISKIWVSLAVNASYWLEWVIRHISQGWDNYSSWVNDMQNSGQMRSNYNLPFLSGQVLFFFFSFLEVLQIISFRRSGLIKNSLGWKIRWRKHYPFLWLSMFSFCCRLTQETKHYF